MKDVLLIVPSYNEEASLPAVIDKIKQYPEYDCLLIDDGSSDGTPEIIGNSGFPHITHEKNMGLTAVFHTGIRYAYDHGYRYAVQIDADGQHDPAYVGRMADRADEGYDVVIGSRFTGRERAAIDLLRKSGSRLLRGAIFITSGQTITDPTSGMRLYNRRAMKFFIEHEDMGPEPSAIAYMIRRGAKVTEVPVRMYERTQGMSYLTPVNAVKYMGRELFHIFV